MRLTVAIGVALLAIIGSATAKPSSAGSCTKLEEGATYGIAGDCAKYLLCRKGALEIKECKSSTEYDTVSGKCVQTGSATCAVEANPEPEPQPEPVPEPEPEESPEQYDYLCQKVLYGVRVHPNACDKFLVCSKEKAAIELCAEGFIFVDDFISCVPGNKETCTVQPDEPSTTESLPSGSDETEEGEESGSDDDSNEAATPEPEPEPSNPPSEETESGEEPSETPGPYDYLCAKTLLGSVAHPESCTKYISCYKYKGKEESCKQGYAYSSKLHLCVKQKNGGCADAPEEQPTTEAATPEPEPEPSNPPAEKTESGEDPSETSGPYDYLCAKTLLGNVAHPDSCTKYISCYKNKAKEQNCNNGYYFSVYLRLCIKGNSETCADINGGNQEPTPTEPQPEPTEEPTTTTELVPPETGGDPGETNTGCIEGFTGFLPIQNDCVSYVYCFQGEPGVRTCLENYIYYDPFKTCLPGDPVLCQLYSV
uniref:Chitin-binding type-2 domain-containing protein n=1 Tax=Anopheles stephensi TaxID=30069 RepID=A0A182YQZ9_ANOST